MIITNIIVKRGGKLIGEFKRYNGIEGVLEALNLAGHVEVNSIKARRRLELHGFEIEEIKK